MKSNSVDLSLLPGKLEKEAGEDTPGYVLIYDILYKRIMSGDIRPGDVLPSENSMASYWNVSRGTIRRAMRLLEEDGFLIRGQGRPAAISAYANVTKRSINWLNNTCIENAIAAITSVRMKMGIQRCINLLSEKLMVPIGERLFGINLGYYHGTEKVAHSFFAMQPSCLSRFNVNSEDPAAVKAFCLFGIFEAAKVSRTTMYVSSPEQEELPAGTPEGELPLTAVEEGVLFDREDQPIAYYKHHLNANRYRFALERKARV